MSKKDIMHKEREWNVKWKPTAKKQLKKWKKTNPEMFRKGTKLEQELFVYGKPVSKKIFTDLQKTYSKKDKDCWHCHINAKGPVYVAVWTVYRLTRRITIGFIGTHEKVGSYARYC